MLTIYSMTICPYCTKAKVLFDSLNIPYEVIDITNDEDALNKLSQKTGRDTVPQIFKGERFIGGYLDVKKMDEEGTLLNNLEI